MANIREIINKGGKSYKATVRVKGYKPEYKTFTGKKAKTAAALWASDIETQMKKGVYKQSVNNIDFDNPCENINSVTDLLNYFEKEIAPTRYADPEKYTTMYDWWRNRIGDVQLKNLTTSMLSQCKQILSTEKIQKGEKFVVRKNNTINKYLMCLSAPLTYAVKELEIISVNPMSNVTKMPKTNGRTRFLSMDEIKLFMTVCKNHSKMIYLFVLLLISTGARYNEVRHLKVENIDFQNNQVYYLDTKNKEHRGVHVPAEILELLQGFISERNISSGYIFLNNKKTKLAYIRGTLQDIIKDLGLKDFHIHDVRHTTASYIAMNGGSLLDIAEILGHKSLTMARRYSHLTKKHTETVLNKVANKILPDI